MNLIATLDAVLTRDELRERWPFTVPSGRVITGVFAEPGGEPLIALAFEAPDKTWYALNGVARTLHIGGNIARIWRRAPAQVKRAPARYARLAALTAPTRADITPIITVGLDLAAAEGYWQW